MSLNGGHFSDIGTLEVFFSDIATLEVIFSDVSFIGDHLSDEPILEVIFLHKVSFLVIFLYLRGNLNVIPSLDFILSDILSLEVI